MRIGIKNCLLGLALIEMASLPLSGDDFTWQTNGNGAWDSNVNWSPSGFPNSTLDRAFFNNGAVTNPVTVTSGQDIVVGAMVFNSTNAYTLNQSGHTLFLERDAGAAQVSVTNTPLTISAPLSTVAGSGGGAFSLNGTSSAVLSGNISALTASPGSDNLEIDMLDTSALTISGGLFLSPPPTVGDFSAIISNLSTTSPALISGNISGNSDCILSILGGNQRCNFSGNNNNFFGAISMGPTMELQILNSNSFGNTRLISFDGFNVFTSAATFTTDATFTASSLSFLTFNINPSTTTSLTGVINTPDNIFITKNLGGTLEIKSNNVATSLGSFQINGGTIKLSQAGALGGRVTFIGPSGILEVDASATNAEIGSLSTVAQPTSQVVLNAPLKVNMNNFGIYQGQFVGTYGQGELDLYGPQTLQISADSSSTMTGLVDIRSGANLTFIDSAALGGPVNLANSDSQLQIFTAGPSMIGPLSGVSGSRVLVFAPLTINDFFTPATPCASTVSSNSTITKIGSGILDFRGNVGLGAGNLNVNAGTVLANSFLSASQVNVAAGATLGGSGSISASQVNVAGTLAPGNSIGTTRVSGNVTFLNGSTFEVEFAGNESDLLLVTQNVTINPGSTIQLIPIGTPIKDFVYTAIATSGTISGLFSSSLIPPGFTVNFLTSNPTVLQFIITGFSLSSVVSSGNPGRVAFYLDNQPDASADLLDVTGTLAVLASDPAALRDALNQLHPAAFSAFSLTQESLAVRSRSLYSERANELFYTSCGCAAPHCYCHGVWLDLLGDYRCESEHGDQYGYKEGSFYAFVGADCFTTSRINTGLSFGYARSAIDWTQLGWKGNMDSYSGAIYASDCFCGTLVDASLQLTYSRLDATRHIEFSDINRNATNDHGSWLWAAHLGLSQYYDCSCFSFVPFAYLDCVDVHEDHFSEQGADSIDLIVGSHRANMVRGELGLRLLDPFCCDCIRVIPSVSTSVVQEWRYAGTIFNSQMEGAVGTFDVDGVNPDRTLFSPGAELLLLTCNDALSFTLRYEGEFGRRVSENVGLVKVSYNF